jgi:hypothetical protein
MNGRREAIVWLAALSCGAFAVRRMSAAEATGVRNIPARAVAAPPAPVEEDSLESLAATITDGNVFRLARRPTAAAFAVRDGRQTVSATPTPPAPPKAALILKAIIGGPPWQGVLEGVPGRDGATVVRSGDKIDRFTVRSISRDTVLIQSPDSTYRLTLKRQWE